MDQSGNFVGTEDMDYEAWRESMRPLAGRFDVEGMDYEAWRDLMRPLAGPSNVDGVKRNTIAGWLRPVSVSGLNAIDICSNAPRYERTHRDVRLDDMDHFKAAIQLPANRQSIRTIG
jgi:hypothetical protein